MANILAWRSTKLKRICRSSTEAETLAMSQALEEGDLIREQILTMTGLSKDLVKMECYSDSRNLIDGLEASTPPKTTVSYRNEFSLIKQFKKDKKLHILDHVTTDQQMADSLTKMGASEIDLIETLNAGKFFN